MPKVHQAIKLIERDGWYFVRIRGSNRHFNHKTKPGTVTIPGPPSEDLSKGLWNGILKQAGLKHRGLKQ